MDTLNHSDNLKLQGSQVSDLRGGGRGVQIVTLIIVAMISFNWMDHIQSARLNFMPNWLQGEQVRTA